MQNLGLGQLLAKMRISPAAVWRLAEAEVLVALAVVGWVSVVVTLVETIVELLMVELREGLICREELPLALVGWLV